MEDGRELPLFKLETTSESHPFYTGTQKSVDNLGGRVEKFRNKFARVGTRSRRARRRQGPPAATAAPTPNQGSFGCLFHGRGWRRQAGDRGDAPAVCCLIDRWPAAASP